MAKATTTRVAAPKTPAAGTRYNYLITRPGAQHRRKEEGIWKTYGTGDQIALTQEAVDSGAYNNLQLKGPLAGGRVAAPVGDKVGDDDVINDTVNPPVRRGPPKDASRTPDGTEQQNTGGEDTGGEEGEGEEESTGPTITKRKLNNLITAVEEAKGSAEINAARQKVIDAGIFEEGTVPTKKAALIQSLVELRDGDE